MEMFRKAITGGDHEQVEFSSNYVLVNQDVQIFDVVENAMKNLPVPLNFRRRSASDSLQKKLASSLVGVELP